MHRAYQPLTPANNIFLRRRWDQNYFEAHRKKVLAATPLIDNKPPKTYMHLHIKLKKLQMEGERLALVERDNRILLEKMVHIMRTGGSVDHRKDDYLQKSLNRTKRQRELLRITHENLAILKRITSKEPHYDHRMWEEEWREHLSNGECYATRWFISIPSKINQKYMMDISKFPHYWRRKQSPYIHRKEQQAAANRRILEQVVMKQDSSRKGDGRSWNSVAQSPAILVEGVDK